MLMLATAVDHTIIVRNTNEATSRQAVASNVASPRVLQQMPVKVDRVRSNSMSVATPVKVSPSARKRTSSGVFQVDDSEPLAKKAELNRSLSDSPGTNSETVANGCQKQTDRNRSEKKEKVTEKKELIKEKKKTKVVEKFDSDAKSICVSAFKESDSWE